MRAGIDDAVYDGLMRTPGEQNPQVRRIALAWPVAQRRGCHLMPPILRDAETGEPIPHVVRFSLHADPGSADPFLASIELYADAAGTPLLAGAEPVFTDDYRAWMDRGQPEGEEPAPQMITTILWCVVADVETPFAHPGPGTGKQVPVEVGDWFAWVEEELADLVRDLLHAGFRPLRESWSRTARPGEFEVSIRRPADEADLDRARGIFTENGIRPEHEERRGAVHTFICAPGPARGTGRLTDDTRAVLAAFIDFVHATDRYPTIDSFGTARTIACLEHALAGLEPAAATAAP